MKKIVLFSLLVMILLSSAYAQNEKLKTKRKLIVSGSDFDFTQINSYKDKELIGSTYELSGTNYKYTIETDYKPIFAGDLAKMKMLVDSAYNFLLKSNEDSRNMFMNVQFIAIPKVKQGSSMLIVPRSDMMHVFQKAQLESILKSIQKLESQK